MKKFLVSLVAIIVMVTMNLSLSFSQIKIKIDSASIYSTPAGTQNNTSFVKVGNNFLKKNNSSSNFSINKFSDRNSLIWSKTITKDSLHIGESMVADSQGNIFLTGFYWKNIGKGISQYTFSLLVLDSNGNEKFSKLFSNDTGFIFKVKSANYYPAITFPIGKQKG
jgi:hypothetical protein